MQTAVMPSSSGRGERFHQLDGLRAIAATLVIVHHVCTASIGASLAARGHSFLANAVATTTASGVELFFVLSGALLLRPYVRGKRTMKPVSYLTARVRRLWPPYLAAWVLAGAVVWLAGRFPTWWTRGADLPEFHISSWLAQVGIVYVGDSAFSFAWWSLTVEVLFYLMVPLLVLAVMAARPTPRQMWGVFFASIVFSIIATNIPNGVVPAWLWPLVRFATYAHCFTGGIMLAQFDGSMRWGRNLVIAGVPYTALACALPGMNVHVGWGLIYFGVVMLALGHSAGLKAVLSRWVMVWVGERSYSLFLTHYSVMTAVCHAVSLLTAQKGARYFLVSRAIELPLVLFVAMVVFQCVERRFAKNLVTADSFWPVRSRPQRDARAAVVLAGDALPAAVS